MDFWRTVEILSKRKWFILLSVIVATALTWGALHLVGSRWIASVQFVSTQSSPVLGVQDASQAQGDGGAGAAGLDAAKSEAVTYAALVKSRDVLEPSLQAIDQTQLPPDLLKNIDFNATAAHLFQLSVSDSSPLRAGQLANALADNFVKVNHRIRTRRARQTVELLDEQLKEADRNLVNSRKKYDDYRNRHDIVGTLTTEIDAALVRLKDARQKQDGVGEKLADDSARLNRLNADMAALPATVPAPAPPTAATEDKQLATDLANKKKELDRLLARYTPAMPIVQKAQQEYDALVERMKATQEQPTRFNGQIPNPARAALWTQISALKTDIAGNQALEGKLAQDVTAARQDIDQFKGIDSPLAALADDVATQTEARNNLATRVRNAQMLADATEAQDPLAIMDRVNQFNPPINASQGRTSKLILLAALCALVGTSGLVIGLDTIDRRLRTVKEAEVALPAPVLAAIPQPMGEVVYSKLARATELYPQSLHSEAFRFLGLHLLSRNSPPVRSLMVCSAKAEQGSTTTLTNLGITLAQAGKKVILVDANIRTSELHQVFEIPNDFGYVDLVQQPTQESLQRALQPTSVENLQVITSGKQPVNPWELFRSKNVLEVARNLHEMADYVLYDTPSSIIFTDALNLAPVIDAAYLCVRALEPITGAEERLVKLLQEAQVPVLGCVLNDVPAAVVEGYHNYQHYYRPAANADVVATSAAGERVSTNQLQPWIDVPKDAQAESGEKKDA